MEEKNLLTIKEAIEREKPLSEYVNYIIRLGALALGIALVINYISTKPPGVDTTTWSGTIYWGISRIAAWMAIASFIGLAILMFVRFQRMNEAIRDALFDEYARERPSLNPFIMFGIAALPTMAGIFMFLSILAALGVGR
ncbi:hypothetical protein AAII07_56950 [Microvirga sp. 0TCS3.31]